MTHMSKPSSGENGTAPEKAKKSGKSEREASAHAEAVATRNGKPGAAALSGAFDAWMRASQVSLIGLFVIALLWCGYVAQPVIVPVLLAWAIATIVLPLVKWMQERGVPRALAAVAVTLLLVTVIVSLLALLSTPVAYWLGRATEVGALIKQKLQTMTQPLALLEELQKTLNVIGAGGQPALKVEQQSATVVTTIFSILTPAVSQFILFIGALVFYLVYQKRLRSTAVYFLREREARLSTLRTLSDIDESMTTYFGTFTIVNFCLGLVTTGSDVARRPTQPAAVGRAGGRAQLHPLHRPGARHRRARGGGPADLSDAARSGCRAARSFSSSLPWRASSSRRRSWVDASS